MLTPFLLVVLAAPPHFTDVTDAVGLGPDVVPQTVSRVCFADLNGDRWPDVVVDRHRVFLNVADAVSPIGRRFAEVPAGRTGLRPPEPETVTVFADLDNDGHLDAIVGESLQASPDDDVDHGRRTGWQRGRGDGTFEAIVAIEPLRPAVTSAIAVGDVDRDGRLDLFLGNWYMKYGESLAGFANDLLRQTAGPGAAGWRVTPLPREDTAAALPEVNEDLDDAGRPTYGAVIVDLDRDGIPELLELNYGRRWNRCWARTGEVLADVAAERSLQGDAITHGRHPEWLKERAKTDPRFDRPDEKPFRANGNTFDAAVGDMDNDGDLDLFLAEITHGWAGDSSDRSRFLLNQLAEHGVPYFLPDAKRNVDRVPADHDNWNQGDLFAALADLDHDGRLDLVLSSGDYPDDQRLRIFLQQTEGSMRDATADLGVVHDGSQQISLADVDRDGDLDLVAGQTFFRYTAEMKAGRTPQLHLFANEATSGRCSIVLRLHGDGRRVNRDALGAVVRATLPDGTRIMRQLVPIGGHSGKQHGFAVHLGLGDAEEVAELKIEWPAAEPLTQSFEGVKAGAYELQIGGELKERATSH